jgi:dihydrofolate reductase
MKISLIVAVSENGTIGRNNGLPWRLPLDLRRFKQLTLGKPVIMGRKTWESIGRPLPGRKNIILTRDEALEAPGCVVVRSTGAALAEAGEAAEIMIIGGASLYEAFLPEAQTVYLTRVQGEVEGDVKFPLIDPAEWTETDKESFPSDEKHEFPFAFVRLDRIEWVENRMSKGRLRASNSSDPTTTRR